MEYGGQKERELGDLERGRGEELGES